MTVTVYLWSKFKTLYRSQIYLFLCNKLHDTPCYIEAQPVHFVSIMSATRWWTGCPNWVSKGNPRRRRVAVASPTADQPGLYTWWISHIEDRQLSKRQMLARGCLLRLQGNSELVSAEVPESRWAGNFQPEETPGGSLNGDSMQQTVNPLGDAPIRNARQLLRRISCRQ